MTNRELKNQVDKLWTEFWTGGITNPLMVIEQISFLMFARLLDIRETREEKKSRRTKKSFKQIFLENKQDLRWSHFNKMTPAPGSCGSDTNGSIPGDWPQAVADPHQSVI